MLNYGSNICEPNIGIWLQTLWIMGEQELLLQSGDGIKDGSQALSI